MIEIRYAEKYTNSYGRGETIRAIKTREQFLKAIVDINSTHYYQVTSVVERSGWFKSWFVVPKQVLLLDCDGTAEMLAACNQLKFLELGYALIQSSPGRYWVVVDKVSDFYTLYNIANCIPGVDDEYMKLAKSHGMFYLRLTPWEGKRPLFEGPEGLSDPLVVEWYNAFEELWNQPEVLQRWRAEVLKKKLKDGTMLDAAADPEFQL